MEVKLGVIEDTKGLVFQSKAHFVTLQIQYSNEELAYIKDNQLGNEILSPSYQSKSYPNGLELRYTTGGAAMKIEVPTKLEGNHLALEIKESLQGLRDLIDNTTDGEETFTL